MRVLIADDSSMLRGKIRELFDDVPGIEIIGETSTIQASIEAMRENRPDAVICDIRFQEGNGIDVLYEAKRMDNPPIMIMFTNYPYPHYQKRCRDEQADYFFDKSSEFEDMVAILRELAAGGRNGKSRQVQPD
ncbi:response regulator [bacterium]|nr:response regulator [bacterium]